MTLALYRKYRPRTFSEIIGQEHVTEPLSQALRSGNINHAYLFSGPRGCGKTSSARILARSLNCAKGPTPDPCGECESCRALAPDGAGSIDVIEIDAASHGGVDDARDLRERAFFAPVSSRYKIYVIDEAHMVSSAGFNALLKLVEEPPDFVKFVFATTEPEKVLATIKSRTHHYPFRLIRPGVLRPYLEQLAAAEGVKVEPAVFPLVVRAGGGSARDSLSVLDQLIAGAGESGVTYARAVGLLGVTDVALIDEVCDALAAGDGAAVYSTINRVAEAGHDARRFAGDLLERLRNLIVLQQVPDAIEKGLLDGADDELARMRVQAEQFGPATLSRMADIVHTGLIDMRGTTAPRLVLELIAARMLLPGAEDSTAALLARMERMERRITLADTDNPQTEVVRPAQPLSTDGDSVSGAAAARAALAAARPPATVREAPVVPSVDEVSGIAVPPPPSRPGTSGPSSVPSVPSVPSTSAAPSAAAGPSASSGPSVNSGSAVPSGSPAAMGRSADDGTPLASAVEAPARSVATGPGTVDAAGVRRIWDEVLTLVRRKPGGPRAAAVVREATVREVKGDLLVLVFKHAFHAEALAASPGHLQEALYEVLGGQWRISCEVAGQSSVSAERSSEAPPLAGPSGGSSTSPVGADPSARPSAPAARVTPTESRSQVTNSVGGSNRGGFGDVVAGSGAGSGTGFGEPSAGGGVATAVRTEAGPQSAPPIAAAQTVAPQTVAPPVVATALAAPQRARPQVAAPQTVRPQVAAPRISAPVAPPVAPPQVEEDWPETATLGGSGADGGVPPEPASVVTKEVRPPSNAGAAAVERAAARATKAPSGRNASAAARPPAKSAKPASRNDDDWVGTDDEPPWDPEFDGPVSAVIPVVPDVHVGFDPGDEPIDDETDLANRPTTEQQALDLLRAELGAQKIAES